jgi:OPA family glycerol-3-phosphate transporter-like MFS transporter
VQSVSLGFIVTRAGWQWWPVFLIPFAIVGLVLAVKIRYALPAATKKFILEQEGKTVPNKA